MDDTLCDFKGSYTEHNQKFPDIDYPQSIKGFFLNLKPLKGGVETIKKLIQSPEYSPYILTAPSVRNPRSYLEKRMWIEKYFGYEFCKKLIISPDKSLLKGDYLIDDNKSGKGQEGFEGKLIHFGSREFPYWEAIARYFEIT